MSANDEWDVLRSLMRKSVSMHPFKLVEKYRKAISAAKNILDSNVQLAENRVEQLDEITQYVYDFWMRGRYTLRSADIHEASNRKTLAPSLTTVPWFLSAYLHAIRVICVEGEEAYGAACESEYRDWLRLSYAREIISNEENRLVCDTPPFRMDCSELKRVFHLITKRWRGYHYGHLPRLYEYALMIYRRCLLLSALDSDPPVRVTFIYECEMLTHAFLLHGYMASQFKRKPFKEWRMCKKGHTSQEQCSAYRRRHGNNGTCRAYCADEYKRMRIRLELWINDNVQYGRFNDVRTQFTNDYEYLCVRPTQRERTARLRGVDVEDITTQMLVREASEADYMALLDYLKTPDVLLKTIRGEIGHIAAQHTLYARVFDMYLRQQYNWNWSENIVTEHALAASDTVSNLRKMRNVPCLVQLFNGFVLIYNGVYYPTNSFLDALTQFLFTVRYDTAGLVYNSFFMMFTETHGEELSEEQLSEFVLDKGVTNATLVTKRSQINFSASDSDSEDEVE